jgi:hypothetical protein
MALDWNPWQDGSFPNDLLGLPRDYSLLHYLSIPEIKVLKGAMRVGKSTLLYQMIKHVLDKVGGGFYL